MRFEKVPFNEYVKAYKAAMNIQNEDTAASVPGQQSLEEWLKLEWEGIKLPTRATEGSAGYDFYMPMDTVIHAGQPCTIPTGIRVFIDPGWFLLLLPRSGLGFKFGTRLMNTAGVIDEDYYCAENYGHIMAKLSTTDDLFLKANDRFMQGIFLQYGLVKNDRPLSDARMGGFGSTGS